MLYILWGSITAGRRDLEEMEIVKELLQGELKEETFCNKELFSKRVKRENIIQIDWNRQDETGESETKIGRKIDTIDT